MKVQMRRKMVPVADQEPVPSSQDVYEWSPKPDKWYTVHRRNIFFQTNDDNTRHRDTLIQNFYNALIEGLVVSAAARYSRRTRILEIML